MYSKVDYQNEETLKIYHYKFKNIIPYIQTYTTTNHSMITYSKSIFFIPIIFLYLIKHPKTHNYKLYNKIIEYS